MKASMINLKHKHVNIYMLKLTVIEMAVNCIFMPNVLQSEERLYIVCIGYCVRGHCEFGLKDFQNLIVVSKSPDKTIRKFQFCFLQFYTHLLLSCV